MSSWTDEELRELITLWPTHSVSQLVKRLHRPRWAIRSKAMRLRLDGMRPHNPSEDVEADNLSKRRPFRPSGRRRHANQTDPSPGRTQDASGSSPLPSYRPSGPSKVWLKCKN